MRLFLLITLLLCPLIAAWGPLSHYHFARESLLSLGYDDASLKQGCDMPDSFYFVNFAEGVLPPCTINIDAMHSPITAGYFVQYALAGKFKSSFNSSFDPLSFALGFGSHMIADFVGFHPDGGYLGTTVPSWITEFPFMTTIDALVLSYGPLPNFDWTSPDALAFVLEAGQYYRSLNSEFPTYNLTELEICVLPWQDVQNQLGQQATLQFNTAYYQSALVLFDLFNATSFEETSNHFTMNDNCAMQAIQYWQNQIVVSNNTPEDSFSNTVSYVASLFANGDCAPSSAF
eukprot:TRINITY_DN2914_c0_g1_i1.p1 TRINITY_DN2914_c0_g1~~TRINITY_DN2914_c0_g1_i1.p1  ORF type:complete len:288 (-),score=54.04 TRINITY_DN2914_c0_g1_i1:154-1017(-)